MVFWGVNNDVKYWIGFYEKKLVLSMFDLLMDMGEYFVKIIDIFGVVKNSFLFKVCYLVYVELKVIMDDICFLFDYLFSLLDVWLMLFKCLCLGD